MMGRQQDVRASEAGHSVNLLVVRAQNIGVNMRNCILFVVISTFMVTTIAQAQSIHPQLDNDADTIATDSGDLVIHPVLHGSFAMEWNGETIFIDPYGGAQRYAELGRPDIILITHAHNDHFNLETLVGLDTSQTVFIVPVIVAEMLPPALDRRRLIILNNGESTDISGISVLAVPMYNLPEKEARHVRGVGNGYVLRLGGKNIYISGDTAGTSEMRAMSGIDIAFVCMNLPFTMDVQQAADAVLDFTPAIVYPFHHRGQDIDEFKRLVDAGDTGVEVRLKDWYPVN